MCGSRLHTLYGGQERGIERERKRDAERVIRTNEKEEKTAEKRERSREIGMNGKRYGRRDRESVSEEIEERKGCAEGGE